MSSYRCDRCGEATFAGHISNCPTEPCEPGDDDAYYCEPAPPQRPKCAHVCLKDDRHVERGEPHFYGYELPWPRTENPS